MFLIQKIYLRSLLIRFHKLFPAIAICMFMVSEFRFAMLMLLLLSLLSLLLLFLSLLLLFTLLTRLMAALIRDKANPTNPIDDSYKSIKTLSMDDLKLLLPGLMEYILCLTDLASISLVQKILLSYQDQDFIFCVNTLY